MSRCTYNWKHLGNWAGFFDKINDIDVKTGKCRYNKSQLTSDVIEKEDQYHIWINLPGIDMKDVNLIIIVIIGTVGVFYGKKILVMDYVMKR